jgi:hypothetical protein
MPGLPQEERGKREGWGSWEKYADAVLESVFFCMCVHFFFLSKRVLCGGIGFYQELF